MTRTMLPLFAFAAAMLASASARADEHPPLPRLQPGIRSEGMH